MTNQPELLAVPNFLHSLTVKADLNGITVLKDGRFKKRYTGSKQFEVDINGKLRHKRDMKKLLAKDTPPPGKKKGAPGAIGQPPENSDTVTKVVKSYSLNKPEIRARLFTMVASQPGDKKELYFWTVSFPMKTSDEVIYRLFNTWLTKLRQKNLLKQYLWVAERQGNGTLHFHLCIPHKMSAKTANREMMICLCNASKAREINYNLHACKRYNGVDIAKNRKTRKVTNFALGKRGRRALTSYITKYITKNDGLFTHLAWHNSRGFSMLFTGITFTYLESREKFRWRFFTHSRAAIETEFFIYYPWIDGSPPPQVENELLKLNSFIQNLN
jgi:hypothetical protein